MPDAIPFRLHCSHGWVDVLGRRFVCSLFTGHLGTHRHVLDRPALRRIGRPPEPTPLHTNAIAGETQMDDAIRPARGTLP